MNRRGFLGAILAAGVAPAIIRGGILMPVRQIAIPTTTEIAAITGNRLLTIDQITREAMIILKQQWSFQDVICLPSDRQRMAA